MRQCDPRIVQSIKCQNPDLNSAPYETLLTAPFSLLSRCRVWGHGQKGSQARFVDQHGSCRLWRLPLQQQVLGPQRLRCCQGGPSSGHGRFFSLREGQRSRGAACSCSCIWPMDSPVTHVAMHMYRDLCEEALTTQLQCRGGAPHIPVLTTSAILKLNIEWDCLGSLF